MQFGSRIGSKSRRTAVRYLERLSAIQPDNISVDLFGQLLAGSPLEGSHIAPHIPSSRRLLYEARALQRARELPQAIQLYRKVLDDFGDIAVLLTAAASGLYDSYLSGNQIHEAICLSAELFFRRPHVLSTLALDELIKAVVLPGRFLGRKELEWSIVYSLYHRSHPSPQGIRCLYMSYASFLESHNVHKPTDLLELADSFPRQYLIYFLRYVCVPEVMDGSYKFTSSRDLHAERVALCQYLSERDGNNSTAYSEEISRLTLLDLTEDAMRHADRGKVFVDVAGLKRSLDKSLREGFQRFIAVNRLTDEQRQSIGSLLKALPQTVIISEPALLIFKTLFMDLRSRFLYGNDYGLDSYVSVRIRHNILSGEIRGLFDGNKLITRRAEGQYLSNEYWLELLGAPPVPATRAIDEAFAELSATVDSCIKRNDWIVAADV